ncbi:MAG: DUF4870 domain-containing protein [Actinobacteria bacterium]|jgi:uncharacterized Tic20 family protein|nr:DUF4870 domain-containing protein [Actinomycetota bacterium]
MEPSSLPPPLGTSQDEKILGIVMHLLCLVGFPIIGPLIIWLMKKDQSRYLDTQGRELLNFQISYFIYAMISVVLVAALIGIVLLLAVGVASLVLTIIGIVKAADGQVYRFPLCIRLF